ncbi:MAG: hypothetical protein WDO13_17715 [Verrucomicrobiota bacterium]
MPPRLATANPASPEEDLNKVRDIQARVRGLAYPAELPQSGLVSSPLTGLPYLVPILRWVD